MNKILPIAALFFLSSLLLRASSYYVDYSSGSDTNAGTSTTAAWKHCPGDPAATGNVSAKALSAGDTVFFKGGVTYVFTGTTGIALKWNGSSGNPITYDGNSSDSWGSGRAILTDNYGTPAKNALDGGNSARSYITIKSFLIQKMGGAASLPADGGSALAPRPGTGVAFMNGITGGVIDNCVFSELGYWFNKKPMSANSINGCGIGIINCNGLTISNCEFTKVSSGLEMLFDTGGITGLTISNCDFHDYVRWCVDLAAVTDNANINHVNVVGNSFRNYYQFDEANWTGYGDWPHTDGIFHRSDYSGVNYGSDINFYNNTFSATQSAGGSASISITEGPSANIYNNLFLYQGKGRTIFIHNTVSVAKPQVINIVNNTFLTNYCASVNIENNYFANTTFKIKNNAFYDICTGSGNNFLIYIDTTNPLSGLSMNYNLYTTFNRTGSFMSWNGTGGLGEVTLSLLRTLKGFETNGLAVDAKFVSLGSETAPSTVDVHLTSASPAIKAGENLTSLGFPGLSSDKEGKARPASGAWDIGAFAYTSGSQTVAPSNAQINVITTP